jgi:hypothetical protein
MEFENNEYKLPESKTVLVDGESNELIKNEDITPWMAIEAIANQMGTVIRPPNKSCKYCYGRGYVGFRPKANVDKNDPSISIMSKEPVPCSCIFTEEQKEKDTPVNLNRKQRRMMEARFRKMKKQGTLKRNEEVVEDE